jgi:nickel/cobalt exporter
VVVAVALWMIWRTARPAHSGHESQAHAHDDDHDHDHDHHDGHADDHEREHATQIRRRFDGQHASNRQILLFGLTGGLVPCPASITVLMLCLQLKQLALGVALVLCFSIGLALTLVLVGVIAALGMRHAARRWDHFAVYTRRAPYLSGALMLLVGFYMAWHGLQGLSAWQP